MSGKTSVTINRDGFVKNWSNGMTNNVTKMQEGVQRVNESPMAKAAENIDKYLAGVQAAAQSGRTQAALLAVNLTDWKNTTVKKIGERLAGGVQAAAPKMGKFADYLLPTVSAGMAQVNQMPSMTLQDSKNKMLAWVDYMHNNPYKK